ncbi:MAG: threonine synthase [Anaerolineae bacterium]|nr:MAG: threonine synthase [Anaerolineae bacterium]
MEQVIGLRCVLCGAEYGPDEVTYVCPRHGDEGILDVLYDYDLVRRRLTREGLAANGEPSIWRYKPLLPVRADSPVPPLAVGWTPLYPARRLRQRLGLADLWVKDDGRNPSASFKDRASAVGVVKAQELGRDLIAAASTGNAAASLACLSSSVGLRNVIFVPQSAPQAKIAQLLVFGATVIAVRGSYDQAFDLSLAATREYGWYSRNTAFNPYLSEGKKTAAFEICEQLGWQAPDRIFVSVGDGCIIGGLGKGLRDLVALGLIERLPRLVGVQAEGSSVLYDAWQRGSEEIQPVPPDTLADSIASERPRDRIKALRAVRDTDGEFVAVSDGEILAAMRLLGETTGVFGEPAGSAPLAGLLKMGRQGRIDPAERIVVLVTGNGLKDVGSAIKATGGPHVIEPTVEALREAVMDLKLLSE